MEPENLQSVLQEAGIQVDMKNLQNPTEDFLIYLITEYLNKFNFDGNKVAKPTVEQLECVSFPDSTSDAIKILNLYTALSSVCHEIFLNDFCLTDITSPGPKRARRQIKILFNFFAYVRTKMVENEMAFEQLDNQQKDIEEMIDKKNSILMDTSLTINDRENKLALKEKLKQEIDEICSNMEDIKKCKELDFQVKEVMMQHQDANKKCSDLKARARMLLKITTELESKIVKSPEEYAARSKELEKVLEIKKEERQVLNDSITRKKLQIKNNENAQELVKQLNEQFSVNKNATYKQLKDTSEKLECVQKELNVLKTEIAKWSNMEVGNSISTTNDQDAKRDAQLLFELDNQYFDKEREFNSQKSVLENVKMSLSKKKQILENEIKTILIAEEESTNFIKQYEKYFQNEISEEISLRRELASTINKTDNHM